MTETVLHERGGRLGKCAFYGVKFTKHSQILLITMKYCKILTNSP